MILIQKTNGQTIEYHIDDTDINITENKFEIKNMSSVICIVNGEHQNSENINSEDLIEFINQYLRSDAEEIKTFSGKTAILKPLTNQKKYDEKENLTVCPQLIESYDNTADIKLYTLLLKTLDDKKKTSYWHCYDDNTNLKTETKISSAAPNNGYLYSGQSAWIFDNDLTNSIYTSLKQPETCVYQNNDIIDHIIEKYGGKDIFIKYCDDD